MREIPALKQTIEESCFWTAAVSAIPFSIVTLFPTNTKQKWVSQSIKDSHDLMLKLQKLYQQTVEIEIFSQPEEITELSTEHQRLLICLQTHCIS
jgi:hypothetical protein